MSDYQLTGSEAVIRTVDGAWIPDDPANIDRQTYNAWLADGGVPDPYVPPPEQPASLTPTTEVIYDHENRLRAIEGEPPLSLADFVKQRGL